MLKVQRITVEKGVNFFDGKGVLNTLDANQHGFAMMHDPTGGCVYIRRIVDGKKVDSAIHFSNIHSCLYVPDALDHVFGEHKPKLKPGPKAKE